MKVGILDVGVGNILAIEAACRRIGEFPLRIRSYSDLNIVTHLIIPGVGNMRVMMENIIKSNLKDEIISFSRSRFIFGICLGFQILYESSAEGNCECLGLLDGCSRPLSLIANKSTNVGYRTVNETKLIWTGVVTKPFYFTHSYYVPVMPQTTQIVNIEGTNITAMASNSQNIFGTQYHPELSHSHGRNILKEFINLRA